MTAPLKLDDRRNGHTVVPTDQDADAAAVPAAPDAEQGIIGSILKAQRWLEDLPPALAPEHFTVPQFRDMFTAASRLHERGALVMDQTLLAEELRAMGSAIGLAELAAVDLGTPTAAFIGHYAAVVLSRADQRLGISKGQKIAESAWADRDWRAVAQAIEPLAATTQLPVETGADLATDVDEQLQVVIPGIAIRGATTELVGKIKASGKTTLLMSAIRAVTRGEPFLGAQTRPGPFVLLTEQGRTSLRATLRRAGLLGCADLHIVRWQQVRDRQWPDVAAAAAAYAVEIGAECLAVDTLFQFAGITAEKGENDSAAALAALAPLQAAADEHNLAVIIVRHEGKADAPIGDAGRGSTAFGGAVDILLRLKRPEGNAPANQRLLEYVGRFDDIPEKRVVAWERERGYVDLGSPEDAGKRQAAQLVYDALPPDEDAAISRDQVTAACKPDVARTSVYVALGGLIVAGQICSRGSGKRGDPVLYWRRPQLIRSQPPVVANELVEKDSSGPGLLRPDESIRTEPIRAPDESRGDAYGVVP